MLIRGVEALRTLSHAAFGQHYRLELMLAVADSGDGLVCLGDMANELGVTPSNLQKPLASLVATGLLTPMPDADSRRKYYLRNPSAAWSWVHELARQAEHHATPDSHAGSRL